MIDLAAEWRDDAACLHDPNPDRWFPDGNTDTADLEAICSACPSRGACFAHAITYGERGYWAGTSERERRRMGAARPLSHFGRVKPGPTRHLVVGS